MTKITCLPDNRQGFHLSAVGGRPLVQTYKEASFGSDTLQVGASFVGSACNPACRTGRVPTCPPPCLSDRQACRSKTSSLLTQLGSFQPKSNKNRQYFISLFLQTTVNQGYCFLNFICSDVRSLKMPKIIIIFVKSSYNELKQHKKYVVYH